MTTQIRPL
ncbi:hypothetical protein YPPY101_0626, partial [Yersinia pestis PY-101]